MRLLLSVTALCLLQAAPAAGVGAVNAGLRRQRQQQAMAQPSGITTTKQEQKQQQQNHRMAIDEGDDAIPAGDDWLIGSKEDLFDDIIIDEKETKQDGDAEFEPEGDIPEVMPRCMDARTCDECMMATPSTDGVQECTWFSEGFCEEGW